ncbi:hypothetical protein E4U44_004567 [Claviceps purpurea]|nr:hypothetical protein E4U44_004567 [Claviceps purpurea]
MAAALPTPAQSVSSQFDITMSDDSPFKRKRLSDDTGDRDKKKVHLEKKVYTREDLYRDVGEKYLLLRDPPGGQKKQASRLPRLTEDLFEVFGLVDIAAEVAREKPNGEKNALRKTYKGQIKRLGVAGHFDVQKKRENDPAEFLAMVRTPDLEWDVQHVKGRKVSDGLSESTLSSIRRATNLARGPVPKSVWDVSVLGDLSAYRANALRMNAAKPPESNTSLSSTPSAATPSAMGRPKPRVPPGHDPNRPRRNIKKRSYGDSSYEGYGEGLPDEDVDMDAGYSIAEGQGTLKRRKKVTRSGFVEIKLIPADVDYHFPRIPEPLHLILLCSGQATAPVWWAPEIDTL